MKLVLGESMVATNGGFSRGHPGIGATALTGKSYSAKIAPDRDLTRTDARNPFSQMTVRHPKTPSPFQILHLEVIAKRVVRPGMTKKVDFQSSPKGDAGPSCARVAGPD
jgi:hypothetical protein